MNFIVCKLYFNEVVSKKKKAKKKELHFFPMDFKYAVCSIDISITFT